MSGTPRKTCSWLSSAQCLRSYLSAAGRIDNSCPSPALRNRNRARNRVRYAEYSITITITSTMNRIEKYISVFNIGLQNTFVYRWNYFLRAVFGLIPLAGTIFLWRAVFAE